MTTAAPVMASTLSVGNFAQYPPRARQLAEHYLATLRELPLIFTAMLLREIIGYDWQFPAERAGLIGQLELLRSARAGDLRTAAQSFAAILLSQELKAMPWAAHPERFAEKLTAYLWATHTIDTFRAAATTYSERLASTHEQITSGRPRLCIVLMGRDALTGQLRLFEKLRRHAVYFDNVDPTSATHVALEAVRLRAHSNPAAYAHWYIEGGVAETLSGATTVSYEALTPMRRKLLDIMHTARTTGTVGPEDLRSLMAGMRPEQFGATQTTKDEVLRHFELRLLTDGSGTQIFSTTFVQWAAREVLRRAQPDTLLLRYAPRQVERPMNDLFLTSASEARLDPRGSLIDADMGAYYTWLNLTRLPGGADSCFIACHEGGREAVAIGPSMAAGTLSAQACDLSQILRWAT